MSGLAIPFSMWQCAGHGDAAGPGFCPLICARSRCARPGARRSTGAGTGWVAEHHYLPFHGVIGKGLRHVAVHGETWLALIGWQPGAFKLAARDRWIGWPAEQQFRRLHLIANNSRFVILTPGRVHNLASRVLGLSLRRLSQDIQAVHGYPVFLAETFVDVSRFVGTCYRASNWRSLGLTRGFAREPGGSARWRHHGQPKEIFVFELTDAAAEALSQDRGAGTLER